MDLQQLVLDTLNGGAEEQISTKTGASPSQISDVISAALPVLVGKLGQNASSSDGADALDKTLAKHHDGSLLDNLSSLFGDNQSQNNDGNSILSHVFGSQKSAVEQKVAKKSGVDVKTVAMILSFVAPLVLAHLGKKKQQDNLDAGGLGSILTSQKGGGLMDLATKFLDKNNDGSILDDVVGMFSKK